MSNLKHIDTDRVLRDYKLLHSEFRTGKDMKKLQKRYRWLQDVCPTAFKMATREGESPDINILKSILETISKRQDGMLTKKQAEETVGNMLGGIYVTPIKEKLKIIEDQDQDQNRDLLQE